MKYKPSRDIPRAVRELKTLSPTKIREWIQDHRTKKDARGKRIQVNVTPQAITMWFKRNPKEYAKLEAWLKAEMTDRIEVHETDFENGNFRELDSIKNWVKNLIGKGVTKERVNSWVGCIKRICLGKIRNEIIEGWGLKHPNRLSLDDAKTYIYEMKKRGLRTRGYRLAIRNFFTSKDIVVKSSDISGELEQEAGQYSDLFTPKPSIYKIFGILKNINEDAYLASKFAYKTGSRLTATLNAHAKYINFEEQTITVFEKSVSRKAKRKMEKIIPPDLWEELPKEGKLFNIEPQELNGLLRMAYKEAIPEVAERIPMPFHFWRHMFAQHMLRASNWNYGLVASLGGWSLEALRRYYGMPPKEVIRKFGLETLPKI